MHHPADLHRRLCTIVLALVSMLAAGVGRAEALQPQTPAA
jgi:hypothetical protein